MNDNYLNFVLSVIFLGTSMLSLLGFKIYSKYDGGFVYLSIIGTYTSLIIGVVFFYLWIKNKKKYKIEYSKCPKCKEVFNYNELEKGKCKYCKDIETIELEEYYKKYPEELKEE